MYNVSFGNRLFRPRVLREDDTQKRWFKAPFSLGESRLFDRFPASYGLFRQSLQTIVNKTVLHDDEVLTTENQAEREDPDLLPYNQAHPLGNSSKEIYFARLDIAKAYPSVPRSQLMEELQTIVHGTQQVTTWESLTSQN